MTRQITLVLLYYDAPAMLHYQVRMLSRLPVDVLELLHVVVVDDGSPCAASTVTPPAASFRVFRTMVDVPWNEEFASNLGVSQAETKWVLVTDIDHEVPAETLRTLMHGDFDSHVVYRLSRRVSRWALAVHADVMQASADAPPSLASRPMVQAPEDLVPFRPHPAVWFLTKALYDEAGGRDERFRGYYQPSDNDLTRRLERIARVKTLPCYEIFHPEGTCAVPHPFGPEDEARFARIVEERGDAPPLRMLSPWERVL